MHEISNSYTTHGFKDLDVFAVRDSHLPRRDLAKRQTGGMYMLHSRSTTPDQDSTSSQRSLAGRKTWWGMQF